MEAIRGTFYAVGVGPGDPELMTVKAVRVLERCPVIAAPMTKSGRTLALDIAGQGADLRGKEILPLVFAMERDEAARRQAHRAAAEAVAAVLDRGLDVAMVNLGDVSIYATAGYVIALLRAMGYETVMVPGVASFSAVAARLGCSLTEMDAPLHIIPAGSGIVEDCLDLPGTKVLMKPGRQLPAVKRALEARKLSYAAVRDCGLPTEQVCREDVPEDGGYFLTLVVKERKV